MTFAVTSPTPTRASAPAPSELVAIDGDDAVTVRPIALSDAFPLRRMFERLSSEPLYRRFFTPVPPPRDAMLMQLAGVDHDRREALVAVLGGEIVGVAHYEGRSGRDEAEIAIAVEDAWQGRGLGSLLVVQLARLAAQRRLRAFTAVVMGENSAAVRFAHRFAPSVDVQLEQGNWTIYAPLRRTGRSATGATSGSSSPGAS